MSRKITTGISVLVLAVLTITTGVWIYSTENLIKEDVEVRQRDTALSASARIEEFIRAKTINIILHSQTAAVLRGDMEAAQFELSLMLRQDRDLRQVSLLDEGGFEILKLTREEVVPQEELEYQGDQPKFRTPQFRYGTEYISPVQYTEEGDPWMIMSVPVLVPEAERSIEDITTIEPGDQDLEPGSVLGVLAVEVSLEDIMRSVSGINAGDEGHIFIIDHHGERIIGHPNIESLPEELDLLSIDIVREHIARVEQLRADRGGLPPKVVVTSEGGNEFGNEVLSTHLHLRSLGWGIVVQEPIESAFSGLTDVYVFSLIVFISAFLLAIFVGAIVSGFIMKPIHALHKGTNIIASGDLTHRIKIESRDEIGELAQSYNSMAEKLQEYTERVQNERNNVQAIISDLAVGVMVFDTKNKLILINYECENILNVDSEDIVGKKFEEFSEYENMHVKKLKDFFGKNLKDVSREEMQLNDESYIEITSTPFTKDGKKEGTIVILRDITREKMIQESKSEFIKITAHQLRTPLSAIKWTFAALLSEEEGKLSHGQKKYLERANTVNNRIIELINDLLDTSRIESGRFGYEFKEASLVEVIKEVIEKESTEAKENEVNISFKKPKQVPKMKLDPRKLAMALENVVNNAVRYTKEGGNVDIRITLQEDIAEIYVKDEGIGIPKKELKNIFGKFSRGTNAIKLQTEGTGLGLFITKNIIESHGGNIYIESKENEGTTVKITLPIKGPVKRRARKKTLKKTTTKN